MIKTQSQGLTLIEALIAIVLLVIVLAGGIAFYTNATRLITLASHKKHATSIVNAQMETIRRKGYANLNPFADGTPRNCTTINPGINFNVGGLPAASSSCTVTVNTLGTPAYRKIEVALNWTEADGAPLQVKFVTFLAP